SAYGSVSFSILWMVNAVIGGIGSIAGPVISALLFGLLPELSKSAVKASSISFWPQVIAALLLILIVAINPSGLASMRRFIRSRVSAHHDDVADDVEDLAAIEAAASAEEHFEEVTAEHVIVL